MQTFELTIQTVDIKDRKPYGPRYAWQTGERDEMYLNIVAQDAEGKTVYMSVGALLRIVTSGGPAAVVTYEEDNDWLAAPESYCVTANMPARPGSGRLTPKVAPGQVITVKGKVKKTYRNGYSLSHVKLQQEVTV